MSFKEFVLATEALQNVKFYFRDEWVTGLKLGDYPGSNTLSDVLDNLLRGTSIYYYIDKNGNELTSTSC